MVALLDSTVWPEFANDFAQPIARGRECPGEVFAVSVPVSYGGDASKIGREPYFFAAWLDEERSVSA